MAKIIKLEDNAGKIIDELIVSHQDAVSLKITEDGDLILERTPDDPSLADSVHSIIIRKENVESFILAIQHFCSKRGLWHQC